MGHKPDVEKARSGLPTREFCRHRKLHESQFYWWRRHLATKPAPQASKAAGAPDTGIELVLPGGRRLCIAKGVDESTLRSVLAAPDEPGC